MSSALVEPTAQSASPDAPTARDPSLGPSLDPSLDPTSSASQGRDPRSAGSTNSASTAAPRRERFWDAVKAIALVRVVAWHTWGFAPLSWFGAMGAMFLSAGALLEPSLARHGYATTVRRRLRRLLLPYWAYALVAVAVMTAAGWTPSFGDLLRWVLPLWDPPGPAALSALWVPLWYLRAYLWMILLSGPLARLARRGLAAPLALAAVALIASPRLPMPLADLLVYAPFVLAGMVLARRGLPTGRRALVVMGAGAGAFLLYAAALAAGRLPAVANASYAATVLVGVAACALLLTLRRPLRRLAATGRPGALVALIGSRSLTIYLWHGVGLLAAQRLVWARAWPLVVEAPLAAVVVVATTVVLVGALGWIEDLAARRPVRAPARMLVVLAALAVTFPALLLPLPDAPTSTRTPLSSGHSPSNSAAPVLGSGAGVLANAAAVKDSLRALRSDRVSPHPLTARRLSSSPSLSSPSSGPAPALPGVPEARRLAVAAAFEQFVAAHDAQLAAQGSDAIDLAVATAEGTVSVSWRRESGVTLLDPTAPMTPFSWFSMTKAVTTAWLMHLVDTGVVALDDPVGRFLPQIPHGEAITLRMLAQHQSGIGARWENGNVFTADTGRAIHAWMDAGGPLEFTPGHGYQYSRTGYGVLAWALEHASGTTWRAAVSELAARAGVVLGFDEDVRPITAPSTHPENASYRGALWAAGALTGSPAAGARLLRSLWAQQLSPAALDAIFDFAPSSRLAYYGLGVVPACPCRSAGDGGVDSDIATHGTVTGAFYYDRSAASAVMFSATNFWVGTGAPDYWAQLGLTVLAAARSEE